jgi:hypothetical protein
MARSPPTRGGTCGLTPDHWARLTVLVLALALAGGQARAQAADPSNALHGRIELQDAGLFGRDDGVDAALGAKDRNDALANVRLTWEPTWDRWSLQLHYVIDVEDGPNVALARAETGLVPAPPSTWLNLTGTLVDRGELVGRQGLDRLAVAYSAPDFVVRVGRQALTWGSGMVFRPMDLFDPFSPSATDTEYKPGTDMLYVQRLFADGSDLQFIVVPRPARRGGPVTTDASSLALHLHTTLLGHQTTWLLARDHGDWVTGLGVNGALAGASWNVEVVPTVLGRGGTRVSALANISDATTLFGRNATVFAEYFHNGFGVARGRYDLADLPRDLVDRLSRGQLFNTRQDYLAGGLTLEVTPLLNLSPTLIADLDDGSVFALLAATYSFGDNLTLAGGVQAPIGPSKTEFGGLPLAPASALVLAPPGQIYLQLRRYF